MSSKSFQFLPFLTLGVSALACSVPAGGETKAPTPGTGKADSAWLASDTYELGGVARGTVYQAATGAWSALAESEELQLTLIDEQIRFAKNTSEDVGYRLNLLADEVVVQSATVEDDRVRIDFEVTVDLIANIPASGVPANVSELSTTAFTAPVPAEPIGIFDRVGDACAEGDGSHDVSALNYAYYYKPTLPGCELEFSDMEIVVTEIFERPAVYPEYNLLRNDLGDGYHGFFAAIVPAQGDHDPKSRFDAHRQMLEQSLGLEAEALGNGLGTRFIWREGSSAIVIDLYDPTAVSYTRSFRSALSQYQLILYNGHSNYGTMQLLSEPDSFDPSIYQIVMMHSCQSYAYYTRQVFRGKATTEDPKGWAHADVVATGESSYPKGSPKTLEVLLESLMRGLVAVEDNRPQSAPDWLNIVETMNTIEKAYDGGSILYGAAGVRENTWQP